MSIKQTVWVALACACVAAGTGSWAQSANSPPASPAEISTPSGPVGEWLVEKALARIKIVDCSGSLWGVVSWESTPGVDSKNPDPALRTRPTLGMPILLGMTQAKANRWDGKIYNSEDGRTYSANISMRNPDTLRVEGCVIGILCGGENWTRVQPPTPTPLAAPAKSSPSSGRNKPASAGNSISDATAANTPPVDDVCLRVAGASGLPHERGLK